MTANDWDGGGLGDDSPTYHVLPDVTAICEPFTYSNIISTLTVQTLNLTNTLGDPHHMVVPCPNLVRRSTDFTTVGHAVVLCRYIASYVTTRSCMTFSHARRRGGTWFRYPVCSVLYRQRAIQRRLRLPYLLRLPAI